MNLPPMKETIQKLYGIFTHHHSRWKQGLEDNWTPEDADAEAAAAWAILDKVAEFLELKGNDKDAIWMGNEKPYHMALDNYDPWRDHR